MSLVDFYFNFFCGLSVSNCLNVDLVDFKFFVLLCLAIFLICYLIYIRIKIFLICGAYYEE